MKIIFLDIDGVLNNPGTWGRRPLHDALERSLVERFAKLVRETGAKVVLSSTWRLSGIGRVGTTIALMRCGWPDARDEMISETPFLGTMRGVEIAKWLSEHRNIEAFVIVDDADDMASLSDRLVQTDGSVGLSDADCARITQMLSKQNEVRAPETRKDEGK